MKALTVSKVSLAAIALLVLAALALLLMPKPQQLQSLFGANIVAEQPKISMPAMFSPKGGNIQWQEGAYKVTLSWNPTTSGCLYTGTLIKGDQKKVLDPVSSNNPCDPLDFSAAFAGLKDSIVKFVGEDVWQNMIEPILKAVLEFTPK